MLYNEEPSLRSFREGGPLRFPSVSLAEYASTALPFPAIPWPPSLAPTSITTAWLGVCFVHAITKEHCLVRRPEFAYGTHGAGHRETSLIAAHARSPPWQT